MPRVLVGSSGGGRFLVGEVLFDVDTGLQTVEALPAPEGSPPGHGVWKVSISLSLTHTHTHTHTHSGPRSLEGLYHTLAHTHKHTHTHTHTYTQTHTHTRTHTHTHTRTHTHK